MSVPVGSGKNDKEALLDDIGASALGPSPPRCTNPNEVLYGATRGALRATLSRERSVRRRPRLLNRRVWSAVHSYSLNGTPLSHKKGDGVSGAVFKVASLIMIVDDHAVIRRMLREVFEAEDLQVFDAANGAEGVQKGKTRPHNSRSVHASDEWTGCCTGIEGAHAARPAANVHE